MLTLKVAILFKFFNDSKNGQSSNNLGILEFRILKIRAKLWLMKSKLMLKFLDKN